MEYWAQVTHSIAIYRCKEECKDLCGKPEALRERPDCFEVVYKK